MHTCYTDSEIGNAKRQYLLYVLMTALCEEPTNFETRKIDKCPTALQQIGATLEEEQLELIVLWMQV